MELEAYFMGWGSFRKTTLWSPGAPPPPRPALPLRHSPASLPPPPESSSGKKEQNWTRKQRLETRQKRTKNSVFGAEKTHDSLNRRLLGPTAKKHPVPGVLRYPGKECTRCIEDLVIGSGVVSFWLRSPQPRLKLYRFTPSNNLKKKIVFIACPKNLAKRHRCLLEKYFV